MRLSLVVAVSDNGVIGRNNGLPWHLPDELKTFRQLTIGKPVIMGRNTYESIVAMKQAPLKGRTNIVLSRNPDTKYEGAHVVSTMDAALQVCDKKGAEEACIVGGAMLYSDAVLYVDTMYITRVHVSIDDGDAFFPAINEQEWDSTDLGTHPKDDGHAYAFTYHRYSRRL